MLPAWMIAILEERLGDGLKDYLIPPPVFTTMGGEFLDFDLDGGTLSARFPVLQEYRNPYGSMQGGILAALVDNTLGPLSMLVAPPNVTRRLEMKYNRPVTSDLEYVIVEARFLKRQGQQLAFSAEVRDPYGGLLARARAFHWITSE